MSFRGLRMIAAKANDDDAAALLFVAVVVFSCLPGISKRFVYGREQHNGEREREDREGSFLVDGEKQHPIHSCVCHWR